MRVIAYNGFRGIELMETGKVIGNIYCGSRDFAAREVGYIVNSHYQQKGYAVEALSAVIAQAFREGAHRILRRMRSEEYSIMEAAGKGRSAARGLFQAEYLVSQGQKR